MKKLNEVFKEYETFDLSKVVGGGDGGPVDPDKTPKPKPPPPPPRPPIPIIIK